MLFRSNLSLANQTIFGKYKSTINSQLFSLLRIDSPTLRYFTSNNSGGYQYVDYGSKFNSVVKLCAYDDKGKSCGSAVIIDKHWVLTAAHVVENCTKYSINFNNKEYILSKFILHPEYNTNIFGEYDIAIGYSEKPIEMEHYPKLYQNSDEIGKICSIAGCGMTGTFYSGVNISDNKKRAGSNFIDKIEKKVLICSPSRKNEKTTELEYLICSGDSGGGLFIDGKLAGIHSSVIGYDEIGRAHV